MRSFFFRTPRVLYAVAPSNSVLAPIVEKCTTILRDISSRPRLTDRTALLFPQNEVHLHQFLTLAPTMGLTAHKMTSRVVLVTHAPKAPEHGTPPMSDDESEKLTAAIREATGVDHSPNGYAVLDDAFCNAEIVQEMCAVHRVGVMGLLSKVTGYKGDLRTDGVGIWRSHKQNSSIRRDFEDILITALNRQPTKAVLWKGLSLSTLFRPDEIKMIDSLLGENVIVDAASLRKEVAGYFESEAADLAWSDTGLWDPNRCTQIPAQSDRYKLLGTAKALVAFVEGMVGDPVTSPGGFASYETLGGAWPGYAGEVKASFRSIFESRVQPALRLHFRLGDNGIEFRPSKHVALQTPAPQAVAAPPPASETGPAVAGSKKLTVPQRIFQILRKYMDELGGEASFEHLEKKLTPEEWAEVESTVWMDPEEYHRDMKARKEMERGKASRDAPTPTTNETERSKLPQRPKILAVINGFRDHDKPKEFAWTDTFIWVVDKKKAAEAAGFIPSPPAIVSNVKESDVEDQIMNLLLNTLIQARVQVNPQGLRWNRVWDLFSHSDLQRLDKLINQYASISSIHADRVRNSSMSLQNIHAHARKTATRDAMRTEGRCVIVKPKLAPKLTTGKVSAAMELNPSALQSSVDALSKIKEKMDRYRRLHAPVPFYNRSTPFGPLPLVREFRQASALPIAQHEETILGHIRDNDVIILRGDTGCGKSTQVPQYILNSIAKSSTSPNGRVVCTQPRRLAATSLAQRVREERGGFTGPMDVAHTIRYENTATPNSTLIFMTVGILLNHLQTNPRLDGVTHLVVDEVHERDVDCDTLLLILKRLMLQDTKPQFKLILMSATVDVDKFAAYYKEVGQVKVYDVPVGRQFKIQIQHLEEILHEIPHYPDFEPWREAKLQRQKLALGESKEVVTAKKRLPDFSTLVNKHKLHAQVAKAVEKYHMAPAELIDHTLISKVILHVHKKHKAIEGAILTFLPGKGEIARVRRLIENSIAGSELHILDLHSSLQNDEQRKVYDKTPPGKRKVVLATNIAETSLTIPDVVFVIDLGRENRASYQDHTQLTHLQMSLISKGAARQRMGRAGRVRDGFAYRLYSSWDHTDRMEQDKPPEMREVPMEELCLRILAMGLGDAPSILGLAMDPPLPNRIAHGLKVLRSLEIVEDDNVVLTPLGKRVATFSMHPRLAKMLCLSQMFGLYQVGLNFTSFLHTNKDIWMRRPGSDGKVDKEISSFIRDTAKSYDEGANSDVWAMGQIIDAFRRTPPEHRYEWSVEQSLIHNRLLESLRMIAQQLNLKESEVLAVEGEEPLAPHSDVLARFHCIICSAMPVGVIRPHENKISLSSGDNIAAKVDPQTCCDKELVMEMASKHGFAALVYGNASVVHGTVKLENISLVNFLPLVLFGTNEFHYGSPVVNLAGTNVAIQVKPDNAADLLIEIRSLIKDIISFGALYFFDNELCIEAGDALGELITPPDPTEANQTVLEVDSQGSVVKSVEGTSSNVANEFFSSETLDF